MIDKDIAELSSATSKLKKYVNKRVAHADEKEFKIFPTFNDLDEVIDYLVKLHKKYYTIFRGITPTFPVIYFYDWKEIFQKPWINQKT